MGDQDDYRPREHDHLVEPVFGGLGVPAPELEIPDTAEVPVDPGAEPSRRAGRGARGRTVLARFLGYLGLG